MTHPLDGWWDGWRPKMTVAWEHQPLRDIPVAKLVWPCHDIDPDHVHGTVDSPLTTGPIHVELLADGSFFIHDGRHRAIRAKAAGYLTIEARVYC